MSPGRKAQVSVEFTLLLAVSLAAILVIIILAQQQVTMVQNQKDTSDARNAILDLSTAAKEVYAQGEGSRKLVFIRLPSSYEPDSSVVENKSIKISVAGTDHIAIENFNVRGNLPNSPGGHQVWVVSEGNRVRIGLAMLSLSRNSISIIMAPNESASVSFYAESLWDNDIDVESTMAWPHPEVGATPSINDFSLSFEEQQPITIYFQAGPDSEGYYNGELSFTSTDGSASETLSLPISVAVMVYDIDNSPPLNVTPDFWAEVLEPTNSSSRMFTVCTNMHTSLSGVSFAPSPGAPGSWVGDLEPLGGMDAGTCQLKSLSITVPNGTASGTYMGSIEVTGQGVAGARDSITLFITVPSNESEGCNPALSNMTLCNCPVGSLYWETPVCMCQPSTIYVMNGTIVGGPDDGKPFNGTLRGGSGIDIISGTDAADIIYGDESGDLICGHGSDDTIYGGNGDDILDGGPGFDILYGESGYDYLYGKEDDDEMYGGQGNDQLDGGDGDDLLYGGDQNDLIYGGPGDDIIYGDANDDIVCGNSGTDVIYSGTGKNALDGGTGTNTLIGVDAKLDDCYRGTTIVNCTTKTGSYSICGPT